MCQRGTSQLPLDGIFMKLDILRISGKNCWENLGALKSTRITGTSREDLRTFLKISRSFPLRMNNIFRQKFLRKPKHVLCSVHFFVNSCRLWENVEKYVWTKQATNDNIIRRMHFACLITKAVDTQAGYVILYCFSTAAVVTRTRLFVTLYVIACLFYIVKHGGTFPSVGRVAQSV